MGGLRVHLRKSPRKWGRSAAWPKGRGVPPGGTTWNGRTESSWEDGRESALPLPFAILLSAMGPWASHRTGRVREREEMAGLRGKTGSPVKLILPLTLHVSLLCPSPCPRVLAFCSSTRPCAPLPPSHRRARWTPSWTTRSCSRGGCAAWASR